MNIDSEVPLDLNLVLIPHRNPGGHLSCHGHSGSTSSEDGEYEEHLDDLVGCYSLVHFDDPNASSSEVSVNLNEELESLMCFLRDRRSAVMEGRLQSDLPIKTETVFYDQIISQLDRELARSKECWPKGLSP